MARQKINRRDEFEELAEMEAQDAEMEAKVEEIMNSHTEAEEVIAQLQHLTEENKRLRKLLKENGIEI